MPADTLLKTFAQPLWIGAAALWAGVWLIKAIRRTLRIRRKPAQTLANLRLPFEGEWHTYWGGDTPALNHHFDHDVQRYGFDFVIACPSGNPRSEMTSEPLTFKNEGKANDDYFCFNAPVLAPHGGVVTCAVDGIDDNPAPGTGIPSMFYGNTVMIRHPESGCVSLLAHLRKGSLRVREGESVAAGQLIAHCGNSGHSSEPHLHYHVQSAPGFEQGKGVKAFFAAVQRKEGAVEYHYSPKKGDKLSPADDDALAMPPNLPVPTGPAQSTAQPPMNG